MVGNRSMSCLIVHPRIFKMFMKGKFDAYVLWHLARKFQNWIVVWSTACDFMVVAICQKTELYTICSQVKLELNSSLWQIIVKLECYWNIQKNLNTKDRQSFKLFTNSKKYECSNHLIITLLNFMFRNTHVHIVWLLTCAQMQAFFAFYSLKYIKTF